ncbi:MAG: hypothetical protein GY754_11860 [bacterium]|nr:hypothetical protein [bacterium]
MEPFSYINKQKLPYPFCPGCSHGLILDRVNEALQRSMPDPNNVVIVSDIGCIGLSDQWFVTHAFHGLHGRSVVYGQGLKLANPNLHVIVFMGDGGAGIGGHHLLNAAKRNIGITVILANNFNFGMTGGEHSATTPECAITVTTGTGHREQPLRLCETMRVNGSPFTARRSFYDKDLSDIIEQAILFDGFSFVEVMEFCTAYYVPFNKFKKSSMEELMVPGDFPRMLEVHNNRKEYTSSYRDFLSLESKKDPSPEIILKRSFNNTLKNKCDIIMAGSAGQKIRSAAANLARAGILSGLFALQRDDFPVTVKTGHSLSYLKLSAKKIGSMNISDPDFLFILSKDGLSKTQGIIKAMKKDGQIFIMHDLPPIEKIKTEARVTRINPAAVSGNIPNDLLAAAVISAFLQANPLFPIDAFKNAITLTTSNEPLKKKILETIKNSSQKIFEV